VRLRLDAWGDAYQNASNARLGSARRFVRRVQHDQRACVGGRAKLLVRLVVAVDDEAPTLDPGPLGEPELTESRDVRAEPLLGEQPHHGDVGERLRPIDDERIRGGAAEHLRTLPHGALRVDDEWRPEACRELCRGQPLELQLPGGDPGAVREQC
jgi:hypothetical protein